MTTASVPDFQWAIVTLTDGSELAGYVHREHDELNHLEVEIDVPAASGWPANIAVVEPAQVMSVKCCPRADVVNFIASHGWPMHKRIAPRPTLAETELQRQGAD